MTNMQRFETFEKVCQFFVRSALDLKYVSEIDRLLEKPSTNKDIVLLVKQVKSFHNVRKLLCFKICQHIGDDILKILTTARGLKSYINAPNGATCAISSIELTPKLGILLLVDDTILLTVHARYKIILYHFWTLVHMPDEIGLEASKWMHKQRWWKRGRQCSADECTKRIVNYNDHSFAKGLYVKMKSIAEYIDKEMGTLPKTHIISRST